MFEVKWKSTSSAWYRNGRRRKLSDAGERLWHALKDCSDHYGAIEGDEDDILHGLFAGVPGWDRQLVATALHELINQGLVALYEHELRPWLEVLKHDDHQGAEFKRRRPDRESPERARNGSNSRQMTLLPSIDPPNAPVSVRGSGGVSGSNLLSNVAGQLQPTSDAVATRASSEDIKAVFDHWCKLEWVGKTKRRPQQTTKRTAHISQRLTKDKFTVGDLCNALTGYSLSPFWNGKQDGKAHMAIERRLSCVEQVEKGLELYEQLARKPRAQSFVKVASND